ncbi:MAG: M28 family metallopeptidase [Bacteroidota bacterium]
MKKICLLLVFFISFSLVAQVNKPFYQSIVAGVSYDTVLFNLQKLQALGVKSPGSAAITNTKNWLISKYQQFGYTNIVGSNFSYSGNTLTNLVVTKTGDLYPNTYLIVDGHYDSKTGTGTNDNGSGVAIVLEIARLLANVNTHYSIKFINFSGEESGLLGSQDYVDNVMTPQNQNILLVFNIDEVGGVAGQTNNTVTCENDQSSPTANNATSALYTDTLSQAVLVYSNLLTTFNYAYGSDYVPFQQAGKIITGLFETNQSTYPHTTGDNLAHLDTSYVFEIAKASTGAALYFAKAWDNITAVEVASAKALVKVFPNPFSDAICLTNGSGEMLDVVIWDIGGKEICRLNLAANTETICKLSDCTGGFYVLDVVNQKGEVVDRMKLLRTR